MSDRASLLRSTFALTTGRLVAYAAGFFVPILLVRTFPPEEFGAYKQAFLLYETLFFIAQLGLANSLYYFLPRAGGRAGRYVANSLWMLAASGVLVAAPLMSSGSLLSRLFGGSAVAELALPIALYLMLMMMGAPLEIVMIARHRIRAASLTYAGSDTLRAALLVLPALLTRDLRWVLWGAVAFAFARAAATLAYVRRAVGGELRPDAGLARAQLAYALPFALAVVFGTIQLRLHEFVVAHEFDAATYAIYAVGCLQIPFIDFISSPASDLMMVRMTEGLADGRPAAARAAWFDAVSGLALLFFPLVGLLALGARELIVLLFTATYEAAAPVFRVWSATILLVPLLTDAALRVFAETRFLVVVNFVQLLVLVASLGPLLERFGLVGPVLATALAMTIGRAISLVRIRRRLGAGPVLPWGELARVAVAAALAFPAGWAAKWAAGGSLLGALVAGGAAYVAVYALVVWRWGLAPELVALVRAALARFAPRPSRATEAGS